MDKTSIEWSVNEREKGFLEGLIDGEGSISLLKENRPKFSAGCTYKPRLNISNKNRPLLELAQKIIGGGAIVNARSGVYNFDVSANLMRKILPNLVLIAKEKQRLLIIEALDILTFRCGKHCIQPKENIERLEKIYNQIRKTNGRFDSFDIK